jgi:hypothetical protein
VKALAAEQRLAAGQGFPGSRLYGMLKSAATDLGANAAAQSALSTPSTREYEDSQNQQ